MVYFTRTPQKKGFGKGRRVEEVGKRRSSRRGRKMRVELLLRCFSVWLKAQFVCPFVFFLRPIFTFTSLVSNSGDQMT